MSLLQPQSIKIQKVSKTPLTEKDIEDKNFVCGACRRGYNSYPALRLHVKRRHDSIMPPNSKIVKVPRPSLDVDIQSGRPTKPTKDIDALDEKDVGIEMAENDLVAFLSEKLMVTSPFVSKTTIADIISRILAIKTEDKDKWFLDIQDEAQQFLADFKDKNSKIVQLDFTEEFTRLDFQRGVRVLVWVVTWLVQIYVRIEFTSDLCLIFSKIWKVLDEAELSVQDLDNKLIWKKVLTECKSLPNLPILGKDQSSLSSLIQKACQLIGKATEEKDTFDN